VMINCLWCEMPGQRDRFSRFEKIQWEW
jgi:hypothetical protein